MFGIIELIALLKIKAVRIVFKNSFGRLFTVNLCDGVLY